MLDDLQVFDGEIHYRYGAHERIARAALVAALDPGDEALVEMLARAYFEHGWRDCTQREREEEGWPFARDELRERAKKTLAALRAEVLTADANDR